LERSKNHHQEDAMSTLRRIIRTLDAHTLWAFNAQPVIVRRG
jgi:hypothetical protein